LIRAVKNRCINYLELNRTKKEVGFSAMDISNEYPFSGDTTDYPLAILLEKELQQEIDLAIERLPAECRTVFEKNRSEGKTYEEISAEMGISLAMVKYHVRTALSKLREDLGKFFMMIWIIFYL
jgi:RNA polymerase sigma-70 factor (ECF subfamily)